MGAIISALISAAGAVLVCVINSRFQANATRKLIEYKIEELTREVREHNNFARRMPVVEEQIKVINHRIADLEQKG